MIRIRYTSMSTDSLWSLSSKHTVMHTTDVIALHVYYSTNLLYVGRLLPLIGIFAVCTADTIILHTKLHKGCDDDIRSPKKSEKYTKRNIIYHSVISQKNVWNGISTPWHLYYRVTSITALLDRHPRIVVFRKAGKLISAIWHCVNTVSLLIILLQYYYSLVYFWLKIWIFQKALRSFQFHFFFI